MDGAGTVSDPWWKAAGARPARSIDLPPGGVASYADVLGHRAAHQPDDIAFVFLRDGDIERQITFHALDQAARRAGAALAKRAHRPRTLLLYPQGLDFVIAFFAALYAGGVAVPAPSPRGNRSARARLEATAQDCRADIVLTTPDLMDLSTAALSSLPDAPPVTTLEALSTAPRVDALPKPQPGDLALLQYTSGSTSTPKGVTITHGNILANQAMIAARFEHSPATVTVGWLPMFHDMGLIGNMLQPIFLGAPAVLMSPAAFLQEPARWLRAITAYGGNTSGAPNFAYDFCAARIPAPQRAALDLSSWGCAYNGSEPVRAATLDRFSEAFQPHGFRPAAFYPCYGMAEATLFISGGGRDAAPVRVTRESASGGTETFVGSGKTGAGHEIIIVDPETRAPLPDGAVGEIWFAGDSVSPGYWQKPTVNAVEFAQAPAGRPTDTRFYRTGDLGFLIDGEIFVTGRIKDVIIVRGRNHYPHDLEATVQASHPALRADSGAAFTLDLPGREALIIVNEVERTALRSLNTDEIAGAVRAAVTQTHGLSVAAVVLLKVGGIPKTSSGKIQRRLTQSKYRAGTLPVVGENRQGRALNAALAATQDKTARAEGDARDPSSEE